MKLEAISVGGATFHEVNVLIEVPVGGEPVKYELDKAAGALVVDRFLHTPMRYPGNYGFIPNTLSEDGDPCDVLVAYTGGVLPGAVMRVRPVGVLLMEDEHGPDEKIVAVPARHLTRRHDAIHEHTDLPEIARHQIQHFFEHYKDLEPGKWVRIIGWDTSTAARAMSATAVERYRAAEPMAVTP